LTIDLGAGLAEIAAHGYLGMMQRVRIGITGLAVVFLVVLLAAAIVGFHAKERAGEANAAPEAANGSEAAPSDPLAELGVAPGGTAGDGDATQPTDGKR